MHSTDFSIGMLVAFQMFASRVSQPMLRLVGLWQQFQQASLSVTRLGALMNAPAEPYSILVTGPGNTTIFGGVENVLQERKTAPSGWQQSGHCRTTRRCAGTKFVSGGVA